GAFADKNVGTGKTVAVSGLTISGSDSGNYTLGSTASTTANITAKALTYSGTAANKIYDGNTTASLTHALSGVVAGETVTTASGTGAFADKNVGTGKTVAVSGLTISGSDSGNYTLGSTASTTANITAKAVTVSGLTAANKEYDGTTNAAVSHSGVSFSGLVAGDTVTASNTTGVFASTQVGIGKTVTLNGTTYGGLDAGNYMFTDQTSTTANITPKSLMIDLQGQGSRLYDGGTTITLSGVTPTLTGVLGGDSVTVASGNVTGFLDKNAGANKAVTYSGFGLSGLDSGNYVLASSGAASTASITPRPVTVSGLTARDKYYDGTTVATIDHGGAVFTGMIAGDSLAASGTVGTFADPAVGAGKSVTLSGTLYGGADAGNYAYTNQTSALAAILNLSASPVVQAQLSNPLGGATQLSLGLRLIPGSPSTMPPLNATPIIDRTALASVAQLTSLVSTKAPAAVIVAVMREGSAFEPRLITVSIPQTMIDQGQSIDFSLSKDDAETWSDYPQRLTQSNGEGLPAWVTYERKTGTFRIVDSASATFPVELFGTVKDQRILIHLLATAD
ncbi:MAG: hypothetical protein IT389_15130, partial [Nitrospira sp.]|nr:hypothetical protein [Nitrospira sp.]